MRDRINRSEIPGPTLYVAGPFIQHEAYPGTEYFRWGVKGAADGKAKVKQLADAGVNIIKLIDQDQMTMEEVKAVVDEAHVHKLARRRARTSAGRNSTWPSDRSRLLRAHRSRHRARLSGRRFESPRRTNSENESGSAFLVSDNRRISQLPIVNRQSRAARRSGEWRRMCLPTSSQDIKQSITHPNQLAYYQITPLRATTVAAQIPATTGLRRGHAHRHRQRDPDEISQPAPPGTNSTPGSISSALTR